MLELAYRADSNSAAREGLWVRVPPAVPEPLVCSCRHGASTTEDHQLSSVDAYAYLLGLYLGDGMLSVGARDVWKLRITLDQRYPGIIAQAKQAILTVRGRAAGAVDRPGCIEVTSYWKHWPCLFPQHGPGPKHTREVRLQDWQQEAVVLAPAAALAGLIHSDGCRCINRVRGYEYPRYFFSNLSSDIRSIFTMACELVGVEWRLAGHRNIAVSRRTSVAILDRLVGPKA